MESEIEDAYLTGAPVATDENIITSQGVGTAIDFALKLIEVLISEEKAVEIAERMLKSGKLSYEEIAEFAELTIEEVKALNEKGIA